MSTSCVNSAGSARRARVLRLSRPLVVAASGWLLATAAFALALEAHADEPVEGYVPATGFDWRLPRFMPQPVVPADNPMNEAKVELGRRLFYDTRLSINETKSCASCHEQALAFTDGLAVSPGATGELTARNAMSLANVAYLPVLTWANTELTHLEQQALIPMFGEMPVELGMRKRESVLFERLASEPLYPRLFAAAFPERDGAIDLFTITRALGAFQRTLISADSPYDRYRYGGDSEAISESAKRGESLFLSEKFECHHCHNGLNFTDNVRHVRKRIAEVALHNTGLYNIDGSGAYPPDDTGLEALTLRQEDMGRFRTPTLRNIALTAPYMHDGSIESLEAVLEEHYAAGGRTIVEGPHAGDGSSNPLKSSFLPGFDLSAEEKADLIAFLESLTDEGFLTDPRFGDPWLAPDDPAD